MHTRDPSESNTSETDTDVTWGGLGQFEYSGKVLPHALMHTKEMIMRGGHCGAYCTSQVETGHKRYIKLASRYSRKYASRNTTQEHMLTWFLWQKVWTSACNLKLNLRQSTSTDDADASDNGEWARLMRRHLEEIDRSDPDMCFKYALHLSKNRGTSSAYGVIRWSESALERKSRWSGPTYTRRVYDLHKLRSPGFPLLVYGPLKWKSVKLQPLAEE